MSELEQAKQLSLKGLEYFDFGDMQKAELHFRDALQFASISVPGFESTAAINGNMTE